MPRDLLPRIPADAATVLRLGAPLPGLAEALARRSPDTRLIEVSDATAPDVPAADVVVLDRVLERAADPRALLELSAARLSPGGTLVVRLANPRHWRRLKALLAGAPDPGERPLTMAAATALLRTVGLTVADVAPVIRDRAEGETAAAALRSLAQAFGLDPAQVARDVLPEAFVLRAGRGAPRRLLVQAMTLRPQGACNDVRVLEPLAMMLTRPGVAVQVEVKKATLPNTLPDALPRVFLWQRPILGPDHLPTLRRLLDRGFLIVTEFDDHPLRWPDIERHEHLTYRGVHAVQTSTEPLAALYRGFNPEVAVFPNALADLPPPPEAPDPQAPVGVFFGALNRAEDWAPLIGPLNAVLARHGDRVRVEVVHDRAFFDALETPAKRFTPTCGYADYKAVLGRCGVALMPLRDDVFNRMKSDLKFIEAAAHGAVALASPTVYEASIRDGETGILCRMPQDFADALEALLADPALRHTIARRAWEQVRAERLMAAQVGRRLDWLHDLWRRRDALTAALLERVPDLAAVEAG